jgi:hypothetical protein
VIWDDKIIVTIQCSKHLKSRDLRIYILSGERRSLTLSLSSPILSTFASKVIGQVAFCLGKLPVVDYRKSAFQRYI